LGTWGEGAFDNDYAWDWLCIELEEARDVSVLADALNEALTTAVLNMRLGAEALAACEVLAAVYGAPSADLPGRAATWVQLVGSRPADEDLISTALVAVDRVEQSSALASNWRGAGYEPIHGDGSFEGWHSRNEGLRERLRIVG
jgi:Domain of unknown function (DUF4259)